MSELNNENELELEAKIQGYIDLLPAWFTGRMIEDTWYFGLLMITGDVITIQCINSIEQDASGNLWLDATLYEQDPYNNISGHKIFDNECSRKKISINSSHVVAAFELADS